jgi:signal peptidase I
MMKEFLKPILETLKIALLAFLVVFPIRYFLFQPFIVSGNSMVPNFESGDYLFVDELSFRLRDPQRGEVVVFKSPTNASDRYIKRIIGLPGETVEIFEGKIVITNKENTQWILDESTYLDGTTTPGMTKISLKENEYFVLGDNRKFSSDSRVWGVLPRENIVGRVFLRAFPIQGINIIKKPIYSY